MKPKQIEIYDTTLRDGSQGEGINFSLSDKLRIAERLDQFGVHYIEGGWPGSNPKDLEFFKQAARRKWKNARIASFGFTRRKGVAVENDEQIRMLLDAETPVITIVGKTWLLHVTEVLRAKPDENIGMIGDTIRAETRVLELRESKSRPTQGIVTFEHRAFNQHGELVCRAVRQALMLEQPADEVD